MQSDLYPKVGFQCIELNGLVVGKEMWVTGRVGGFMQWSIVKEIKQV